MFNAETPPFFLQTFQSNFSNRSVVEFYVRKLAIAYNLNESESVKTKSSSSKNEEVEDHQMKDVMGDSRQRTGAKGIQFFLAKKPIPPPLPKIDDWWSLGENKNCLLYTSPSPRD